MWSLYGQYYSRADRLVGAQGRDHEKFSLQYMMSGCMMEMVDWFPNKRDVNNKKFVGIFKDSLYYREFG